MGAMRSVEDRFNGRYHYPWTFLSYEKFSSDVRMHPISVQGDCTVLVVLGSCVLTRGMTVQKVHERPGERAGRVRRHPQEGVGRAQEHQPDDDAS